MQDNLLENQQNQNNITFSVISLGRVLGIMHNFNQSGIDYSHLELLIDIEESQVRVKLNKIEKEQF